MAPKPPSATSGDSGSSSTVERLTPTGRRIALIHSSSAPPPSPKLSDVLRELDFVHQEDISALWLGLGLESVPMPSPWPERMPMHKDPVTPQMHRRILERDRGCVALVVDSTQLGSCSGRLTLDHVKDQPRMGVRAPSDEHHLVTLCAWHHQGQKAGRIWATTKEHREWLRMYLEWINGETRE